MQSSFYLLLISNQKFSEPVVPGVGSFYDPSSFSMIMIITICYCLFSSMSNMWQVSFLCNTILNLLKVIPFIKAEVLSIFINLGGRSFNYDIIQRVYSSLHIMHIGRSYNNS